DLEDVPGLKRIVHSMISLASLARVARAWGRPRGGRGDTALYYRSMVKFRRPPTRSVIPAKAGIRRAFPSPACGRGKGEGTLARRFDLRPCESCRPSWPAEREPEGQEQSGKRIDPSSFPRRREPSAFALSGEKLSAIERAPREQPARQHRVLAPLQ